MKGLALIWICKKCHWISVSDQSPHRMDTCKCKTNPTSVDHEVEYLRISGDNYKHIATVDLDTNKIISIKGRKYYGDL